MSNLFWLSDAQIERLKPFFPKSHGKPALFGRLKNWRRVATRYDRCPETFFSAIMLAATVRFWL